MSMTLSVGTIEEQPAGNRFCPEYIKVFVPNEIIPTLQYTNSQMSDIIDGLLLDPDPCGTHDIIDIQQRCRNYLRQRIGEEFFPPYSVISRIENMCSAGYQVGATHFAWS